MHQLENPDSNAPVEQDLSGGGAGIHQMIAMAAGIVRRRYRIILICFLLTLPLGPLYYFLAPQTYTASATMLMETRIPRCRKPSRASPRTMRPGWIAN